MPRSIVFSALGIGRSTRTITDRNRSGSHGTPFALNACVTIAQRRIVKRIDIMETQAPDIAQHWSAGETAYTVDKPKRDEDARAEAAELEQLADRVSAARSIY
jgi:hypothetical protein